MFVPPIFYYGATKIMNSPRNTNSNVSSIEHASAFDFSVLRRDYWLICESIPGNAIRPCAAKLLNIFEQWMNCRLQQHKTLTMAPDGTIDQLWIFRSVDALREDLIFEHSHMTIRCALEALVKMGLLHRRRNPRNKWDKTYQYQLNRELVQTMLNAAKDAAIDTVQLTEEQAQNPGVCAFAKNVKSFHRRFKSNTRDTQETPQRVSCTEEPVIAAAADAPQLTQEPEKPTEESLVFSLSTLMKVNGTLIAMVKRCDPWNVKRAIEAVKPKLESGTVKNPQGFFVGTLKRIEGIGETIAEFVKKRIGKRVKNPTTELVALLKEFTDWTPELVRGWRVTDQGETINFWAFVHPQDFGLSVPIEQSEIDDYYQAKIDLYRRYRGA